jgi:hypothetical protein
VCPAPVSPADADRAIEFKPLFTSQARPHALDV